MKMEWVTAIGLIQQGYDLAHVSQIEGQYFACRTRYNPNFTDLMHYVPSWVWVKDQRYFRIHYLDLPVLESISNRAGYEVKYEPSAYDALMQLKQEYIARIDWKKEIKVKLDSPRPFRKYQILGAQFMFHVGHVLNADGMGCISGDAEIIINRGGNARRYNLRDAYLRFNGLAASKDNWKLPSYTRSLDGDRFSLNRIEGIVCKGHQHVIRIVTESGREIIATPDHVFFTPQGERAIGTMSVGDELLVNGKEKCIVCGKEGKLSQRKFKGACRTCVYRRLRHNASTKDGECIDKNGYVVVQKGVRYHPRWTTHGIYKHRLVYEAKINFLSYDDYMSRLSTGDINGLLFLEPRQIVHHLDGDKRNNAADNLGVITASNHGIEHSESNIRNLWNVRGPKTERIASIEDAGTTDVYDVMMAAPRHSFIVNGFVVHNSGKSQQAIGAVMLNEMNGLPFQTLVVCPASMKFAWEREFNQVAPHLKVLVLDRSLEKRQEQYLDIKNYNVAIITFGGFLDDYEELAKVFPPNILIIDEAHRICNRTNKITQALIGGKNVRKTFLAEVMPHSIYLLTGTPISNKLEDLYALMRTLDPGLFTWTGFANRYTIQEQYQRWDHSGGTAAPRSYFKIEGYKNEAELKAKLSLHMIRRTKDEVLPELPPKVFQTIELELSPEERKIYNDLKKNYRAAIRDKELTVLNQLTWMMRAQQIANSLESVPDSSAKKSTKLDELCRIVDEQAKVRKIVIFSKFKVMTSIICRELQQYNPVHFHGGVDPLKRQEMIDRFQNDPDCRLFVSTIHSGGVGITLTAADMVVMYDRWWAPSVNNQAVDRLHRIGQKNSVLIVTLRMRNTVEEHIERTWMEKQNLVCDMVGDEEVMKTMTRDEMERLI